MSAFTRPVVIGTDGTSTLLNRVPLTSGGDGLFDEKWLQRALFNNPECLPVNEIDPHIGSLIAVCLELETGAGPVDILLVTPTGQIVLVETKLWRNPEARRAVVGQILDYAKQLTSWDYDKLDFAAAKAAKGSTGYLLSQVRLKFPEIDEAAFVDGVNRCLSTGDFLLLIVGDGIRYGAESLITFLDRFGHMRFGFGLLEVAAYLLPDGQTLLQPRILAKTELLQRTLIMGPSGPISFQQAAQADDEITPIKSQREWFMNFWRQFLGELKLDEPSLIPVDPAKSTNQYFSMPPANGKCWISAYIAQGSKSAGVYLTFLKGYERAAQIFAELQADRATIEQEVGVQLVWEATGDKYYVSAPTESYEDLNAADDRKRVICYLADMTQRMDRALRPRLASMA